MKITNDISKEIYKLAKDSKKSLSNQQIADKFGITEGSVRFHINKNEKMFYEIAKSNDKAANGLVNHSLNVSNEAMTILSEVRKSISEAKGQGVSPEKLAPLYGNWIKSLELASEILGDINRAPVVNIQVNQRIDTFMQVVLQECDAPTKARISQRMKEKI